MRYEEDLKSFIRANQINAEHLSLGVSCHSVKDAAAAVNAEIGDFVKNICMISPTGQFIVAIVKGEDNASTSRVGKALNIERPRLATSEEVSSKTKFPCGGIPSFGFSAVFLIDPKVMEMGILYTGGGSEISLVRISPKELLKANKGQVVRVRR